MQLIAQSVAPVRVPYIHLGYTAAANIELYDPTGVPKLPYLLATLAVGAILAHTVRKESRAIKILVGLIIAGCLAALTAIPSTPLGQLEARPRAKKLTAAAPQPQSRGIPQKAAR